MIKMKVLNIHIVSWCVYFVLGVIFLSYSREKVTLTDDNDIALHRGSLRRLSHRCSFSGVYGMCCSKGGVGNVGGDGEKCFDCSGPPA